MPRILKYNYVNFENEKINIEPPEFDYNISFDDFENNIDNSEFVGDNPDEDDEINEIEELDVKLTSEDLIKIAKIQADEIIEKTTKEMQERAEAHYNEVTLRAKADAEEIYKKAETNGYNDGYNRAVEETGEMKVQARKILEDAHKEKEEILNNIEPEVVELTVSVINKVLNDAIVLNPQIIQALIKKGLSETKMTGNIFIHISEHEYEAAVGSKNKIPEFNDPNVTIEFVKDYSLERGGCIFETEFGNIDCSLDSQFTKIKEILYFILESR